MTFQHHLIELILYSPHRILFSIWDQGGCNRDKDPNCPAAQTAQTIACGTGIRCTDFGGEGTGRKR